jgi:hypothetical protein
LRFSFVRPDKVARAITSHLSTVQQFASEVVRALQEAAGAEWDRTRFGERS